MCKARVCKVAPVRLACVTSFSDDAAGADLPDDMSVIPEADYDHLLVDA